MVSTGLAQWVSANATLPFAANAPYAPDERQQSGQRVSSFCSTLLQSESRAKCGWEAPDRGMSIHSMLPDEKKQTLHSVV